MIWNVLQQVISSNMKKNLLSNGHALTGTTNYGAPRGTYTTRG
jgi:hypothetical protein